MKYRIVNAKNQWFCLEGTDYDAVVFYVGDLEFGDEHTEDQEVDLNYHFRVVSDSLDKLSTVDRIKEFDSLVKLFVRSLLEDTIEHTKNKLGDVEVPKAFETLKNAMSLDHGYAWGWHCNIAMSFVDEGGTRELGNKAAARFMQIAFGIDTSKFEEYQY